MALANYNDLQSAVQAWVQRMDSSFVGRTPDFIRLAESRIWRRVRLSDGVSPAQSLSIVALQNWVALPSDWLGFKRLSSNAPGGERLDYLDKGDLDALPTPGDASYYSIEGGRLYYGTQGPVTVTHAYYKHPGFLANVGTTWLLTKYPDIYLYASLLEAAQFIKKPSSVAEYGTLLDRAIDEAHDADKAAQISGGALRMRRR